MGSAIHQGAIVTAFDGLRICAARRELPWFVGNQQTLLIPREDRRLPRRIAPDVFVYPTLTISNPTSIAISEHGPPTLAIEVASPGTALSNDINIFNPLAKPRLYERIGVAEYLAFDPTREIFGDPIWAQHSDPAGMGPWLPEEDGRWHSVLGIVQAGRASAARLRPCWATRAALGRVRCDAHRRASADRRAGSGVAPIARQAVLTLNSLHTDDRDGRRAYRSPCARSAARR